MEMVLLDENNQEQLYVATFDGHTVDLKQKTHNGPLVFKGNLCYVLWDKGQIKVFKIEAGAEELFDKYFKIPPPPEPPRDDNKWPPEDDKPSRWEWNP